MSLRTFTHGSHCIKVLAISAFALLISISGVAVAGDGWSIDFSRRNKELRETELNRPTEAKADKNVFSYLFEAGEPVQEIVILNTDKGFIPSTVRVRKGLQYKVNVVNVNDHDKNVSFVLDSFSEHHATYYGQIKSFHIKPQKRGVYQFQCPETSAQGRLVVYPYREAEVRLPASEE